MSMMLSDTYEAFISAGVPADKAKKASEEIASFDKRLVKIEIMLQRMQVMNTLMLAGITSLVLKTFF